MGSKITCRSIASGKPNSVLFNIINSDAVLLTSNYYSVPDTSNRYPDRDPVDSTRGLRPGQFYITAPVFLHNLSSSKAEVIVCILQDVDSQAVDLSTSLGRYDVLPNSTVAVEVFGRSVVNRALEDNKGGALAFKIINSPATYNLLVHIEYQELASQEHAV